MQILGCTKIDVYLDKELVFSHSLTTYKEAEKTPTVDINTHVDSVMDTIKITNEALLEKEVDLEKSLTQESFSKLKKSILENEHCLVHIDNVETVINE